MSQKRKYIPILISTLIGILSLVYYLSYYKYFKVDVDEGLLINGAMRVLSGELPLKDFHQYTLGRFYLLAGWFLLLGKSIAVERLLFIFLHTLKNILAFHVSRKIMPLPFSLIPAVMLMIIPGFWTKAFVSLVLLANIYLILIYLANPKKVNLFLLGVTVGVSVYFREDLAGYSFITFCIVLLFLGISEKSKLTEIFKKWIFFGLSVFTAVLPMIFLYWLRGGLSALVEGIYQTVRLGHIESFVFRSPLIFLKLPINIKDRDLGLSFSYFSILLFVIFGLVLLSRFYSKRNEKLQNFNLLGIWILALFSFTHIWHWTHEFRIPQSGSLTHILWAFCLYLIYCQMKQIRKEKKGFFVVKTGALLGIFVLIIFIQFFLIHYSLFGHSMVQYDGGGITLRMGAHREINGTDRAKIFPPARQAIAYSKILHYLKGNTEPEDRILCFGESPIYFLSKRRNATEFDNGRIPGYFPEKRRKCLLQIRKNKPKIIVFRQWEFGFWYPKMPEVLDYITSRYFLDRKIHNFYIFSYIDKPNKYARKGNTLYWKGQIEKSTTEYLKALKLQNKNPGVRRILNRLFLDDRDSRQSLKVLDGFYLQKTKYAWRLRWGSRKKHKFSGRISFPGPKKMDTIVLKTTPFPRDMKSVNFSHSDHSLEFSSDISSTVGGFDIIFSEAHPSLIIQIELKKDDKKIERIFLAWKGFTPTGDSFELKRKAQKN